MRKNRSFQIFLLTYPTKKHMLFPRKIHTIEYGQFWGRRIKIANAI